MLCAKTTNVEGVDGKTYAINGTTSTATQGYFNSSIPNSKQIGNFIGNKKSSHLTKAFKMNAIIINASNYTEFETCDSLFNILATNTVAGNVITIGGSQYGFILENLAIKIQQKGDFYRKNKKEGFKLEENKQQIKGLLYEQDDINKAFALLNTILVSGEQQVKAMGTIFDILKNPIPFKTLEEEGKIK